MALQDAATAKAAAIANTTHNYDTQSMISLDGAITAATDSGESLVCFECDVVGKNIVHADKSEITLESFLAALQAKEGYTLAWVIKAGKLILHLRF